jgi:hypothetical protein
VERGWSQLVAYLSDRSFIGLKEQIDYFNRPSIMIETSINFGFLLYFASVNRQQELLPKEVVHIGFKIS